MIIAMEVKSAAGVVGSNSLRVYTFSAPNHDDLTVVANLTNVYDVGDVVAVATVGEVIGDLTIKERKLFGITSCGMALGKTQREVGSEILIDEI